MPLFNLGFLKARKPTEQTSPPSDAALESDSEDEIVVPPSPVRAPPGKNRSARAESLSTSLISDSTFQKPVGRRRGLDMADAPDGSRAKSSLGKMLYSSDNGMLGVPAAGRPGNILAPSRYIDVSVWRTTSEFDLLMAVQLETDRAVLAKVYDRSTLIPSKEVQITCQQYILSRLSRVAGVLRYYGSESDQRHICFLFKQDLRSSLKTFIAINGGQLSEGLVASQVIAPLAVLLSEIHRLGVIHRDICPENILFNGSEMLSLIGFDHAVDTHPVASVRDDVEMGKPNLRLGTLCYMAPEVANSKTPQEAFHEVVFKGMSEDELPQYTATADVFSMGVLMYTALTGTHPWDATTASELQEKHREANIPDLVNSVKHISDDARDFLAQCLTIDPEARPGSGKLLEHQWLRGHVDSVRAEYDKLAASNRKSVGRVDTVAVARRSLCAVRPDVGETKPAGPSGDMQETGPATLKEAPSRLTKYSEAPHIPETLESDFFKA